MGEIEKEIDRLGRVVIPAELRKAIGVGANSKVLLSLSNDSLIIRAQKVCCAVCGESVESKKIRLCNNCIAKAKED